MSRLVMIMKKWLYFPLLLLLVASLIFGAFPFGSPSTVYSAQDVESLWSESNSVSSTELTLTDSTNADGSTTGTWANAKGNWAKTPYEWWEFVMENSPVGQGTINSVTLYLKHYQDGWADDGFLIQIYDGSTWIDVESYSSANTPPIADTTDSWNVTTGIDTWAKIEAAKVRIIGNVQSGKEDTVDWFVDTVELRIDYTPPAVFITISPTDKDFGVVLPGKMIETVTTYFTLTNKGTSTVNIDVHGADTTGGSPYWALSDTATPGTNIYGLKFKRNTVGDWTVIPPANVDYMDNLDPSATDQFGLMLLTPTVIDDTTNQQTGIITFTAVAP